MRELKWQYHITQLWYNIIFYIHCTGHWISLAYLLQVCALKHHHFYPPSFSEIHFTLFFADLTFLDATLSDIHQYLSVSD